ncbi:hypothetical protein [Hungatella effluvii]|uniref:hypothetical protein n=1 Tax=Hungatella effluvii TaxID=1096246 RepID=UPI0022E36E7A|nr:hypothetical protein [Hungatella effluvii]
MDKKEIILFTASRIIESNVKTIGKYINNALKEKLQDQPTTVTNFVIVQKEGERAVVRQVVHYNLDVARAYSISRGICLKEIAR